MMLVGDRVCLRPLEESDLERTLVWVNTQEIVETVGIRAPVSAEQQRDWFAALANDTSKIVFAICRTDTGEHIGNVSLRDMDAVHRTGRFSIFIADAAHRGHGFGSEAAKLMLCDAFGTLGLHRVHLKTTAGNAPAVALYEALGFVREGLLREHEFHGGRFVDKLLYGMLDREWGTEQGGG